MAHLVIDPLNLLLDNLVLHYLLVVSPDLLSHPLTHQQLLLVSLISLDFTNFLRLSNFLQSLLTFLLAVSSHHFLVFR